MENIFYLLSAHTTCIEGICLSKKNNNVIITKDCIGFSTERSVDAVETSRTETEQWATKIGEFLDQQQWRNHAITLLLPAEDVTFRKLTFPFQEQKKVEQALPFELEEELMGDLAETAYSVQVHQMSEQNSEALVLLIDYERLQQLQQLCLKRDLLIRNVDCSAHALYRTLINDNSLTHKTQDLYQIYLGGDESFMNTIREGRLDEIKIFPNRIPEILQQHLSATGNSLSAFLQSFAKHSDGVDHAAVDSAQNGSFIQLKEELRLLCAKLSLHLRVKNYSSGNQIEVHGILGPIIKWDGVKFMMRSFPLPEAEALTERSVDNSIISISSTDSVKDEITTRQQTDGKAPGTLEELMVEAKHREKSNEKIQNDDDEIEATEEMPENLQTSKLPDPVNPQASLLSLIGRKHWGVLGELRKEAELFLESHQLSLHQERTPWRGFLRRNRVAVAVAASLMFIISVSFAWQTKTQLNLLQQEITRAERLIQSELRLALPQTSASGVNAMLMELEEKIKRRKVSIEISKNFEKRDYHNLRFLKYISTLLSEDAPFQVGSLEYVPERFSFSGTIDSYERLQILKNNLKEIEEFKGKRIVESNRKSPEGIVYRISIDLK